jgi:hypothetical protein
MAGDWLKIEHATPDKPELHRIAELSAKSPGDAFIACVLVWRWVDQQSIDGVSIRYGTKAQVDRVAHAAGFADALEKVGWLVVEDSQLLFPNGNRHMGETAKRRSADAKRKASVRKRPQNVRETSAKCPQKNGQNAEQRREEKRREDTKTPPTPKIDTVDIDTDFDTFWSAYPRKENKAAARKAWLKADRPAVALLLAAIDAQRQTDGWQRGFVPHASTWLNNARWEDEVELSGIVATFDSDPDDPVLAELLNGDNDE